MSKNKWMLICVIAVMLGTISLPVMSQERKQGGGRQGEGAGNRPKQPGRTMTAGGTDVRPDESANAAAASETDAAAERLIKSAEDLLAAREFERAIRMLETVIERFPESPVRFKAHLALGKHFADTRKEQEALKYLRHIQVLEKPDEPLQGPMRDVFLEGMYTMGVAYYQLAQYTTAFPILRKITKDYPNTVWSNQAYYFIGMCHFAQGNWQKAIEALSLVGTFVDPTSPTIQYVEAGRRFYVKIEDNDLPILTRLGKEIAVSLQTSQSDKETIVCIPLAGRGEIFIGSIPTEVGVPKAGNNTLEVAGGDSITVTYLDNNTQEGKKDEPRKAVVKVVSTAGLDFTLGTYESRAEAAFIGQPVFVLLQDADLDRSPKRDTAPIKVISRYRDIEAEELAKDQAGDIEKLMAGQEEIRRYRTRDEVTLTLEELGEEPVRTGKFAGKVEITGHRDEQTVDTTDNALVCATGDEIIMTYIDELHIGGESPRQVDAMIVVSGEIENRPMATQYVVADPVVRARKNAVEATAYLELGRIFKSMGLLKGAADKCDLGLAQVEMIIRSRDQIPVTLTEEAFRLKWELEIVKEDFDSAIATCQLFNKMFPQSPIVDQALLGIGKIHLERNDYKKAQSVFEQILKLPNSLAKAEAQFRIAETVEAQAMAATPPNPNAAIPHYKLCAERYPDSEFAGESLGKLIDYHVETKDYAQADDLLNQIFQDHPDAQFLDGMLLKWVVVSFRMGNFQKAQEKCAQLLFEYPESRFAERAKALMPRIEEKVKGGSAPAESAAPTTNSRS